MFLDGPTALFALLPAATAKTRRVSIFSDTHLLLPVPTTADALPRRALRGLSAAIVTHVQVAGA